MPSSISVADFPDARWRGQWIWVPEEPVTPTAGWGDEFIVGGLPDGHGLSRCVIESPVAIELEFAGVIEALPAGHHIQYNRQGAHT